MVVPSHTAPAAVASLERADYDVAVVGAGLAGLVAGVTAAERGARVVMLDSNAPGGRARTTERDGFGYNTGPHALYRHGHLQSFLSARNISPAGGFPSNKHVRLLRDGRLTPLGLAAFDLARTPLLRPRSRARALSFFARVSRMNTAPFVGLPWDEFLGNEPDDFAGLLAMIVRTGTYVDAPSRFDAAAALEQLQLGLRGVRYIDGGWQTIVDSLMSMFVARGGTFLAGRPVSRVTTDGRVTIETADGPIHAVATIIAGLSPDAVERIAAVSVVGREGAGSAVRAAVLDLALDRVHQGLIFGIDCPLYLSPHAPVARLAPVGKGLVTLMRYVPDGESGSADTDRSELNQMAELSGIAAGHILHSRYMHRLAVAHGFPVASGGGVRGRPAVGALGLAGVFLAGDWVGPRGQLADASAASGESAASEALAHISRRTFVRV